MRILIATGIFPPDIGGPATYAAELASILSKRGHDVRLLTYSNEARYTSDDQYSFELFRVVRGNKLLNRIKFFVAAMELIRGADVIYSLDWFAAGLPLALAAKFRGVPYIVRVGGDYLWEQKYLESGERPMPLREFYERGLHQRATYGIARRIISYVLMHAKFVAFNSDVQKELYERYYALKPERCITIENPAPRFEEIKRDRATKEFVFWGRLIVMKNVDSLLRAFARAELPTEYSLAVIGDGPRKTSLELLARDLGLADRVRFEPSLPLKQALERVKNGRAFVLPSWTDVSPNQVYEALSIGLPALVTRENYLSIRDRLPAPIDPSSIADIAKKLELLADDRAYADFSSRSGSIKFERDWNTVVDEHLALFGRALGSLGLRVLQIGADRSKRGILYPGTPAFARQQAYAATFGRLDIIGFSKSSDGAVTYADDHLTVTPTNSSSLLSYGKDAIRIAKTLPKPSLVSAQDPFETGLAAWRIARRLKIPLHVQIHTDFLSPEYASSLKNRIRILLAGYVLRRASAIRVVSERIRRSVEETYHVSVPITVLPIFVDVQKIRTMREDPQLIERFSRFKTKLLFVGRLEPEKNAELAVRSFAEAAPKDACLIIVGEGSERGRLEQLVRQLAMSERILFEGEREAGPYYRIADLVLMPSRYEGYGLVIVEALAAGKPVLSTDVGVAREMGAIVSNEKDFPRDLKQWFANGPRSAELKTYPYENFETYVRSYCDNIYSAVL